MLGDRCELCASWRYNGDTVDVERCGQCRNHELLVADGAIPAEDDEPMSWDDCCRFFRHRDTTVCGLCLYQGDTVKCTYAATGGPTDGRRFCGDYTDRNYPHILDYVLMRTRCLAGREQEL